MGVGASPLFSFLFPAAGSLSLSLLSANSLLSVHRWRFSGQRIHNARSGSGSQVPVPPMSAIIQLLSNIDKFPFSHFRRSQSCSCQKLNWAKGVIFSYIFFSKKYPSTLRGVRPNNIFVERRKRSTEASCCWYAKVGQTEHFGGAF